MPLVLDGTNGVSGVDGTASNPAIEGTDSNTGIFYPAADTVAIGTGGTERLRVDSAGNTGFGVTPSAWNITALQVKNGSMYGAGSTEAGWYSNAAYNSAWRYISNGAAAGYTQNGNHQWFTAASGTAGNAITFTQAMTLDASGNLGVGITSPVSLGSNIATIDIGASSGGGIRFRTSGAGNSGYLLANVSGVDLGTNDSVYLRFVTAANERARITSGGDLLVGTTSAGGKLCVSAGNTVGLRVDTTTANESVIIVGSGSNLQVRHPAAGVELYNSGGNAIRVVANTNGVSLAANQTSWGAISDERNKDIIEPIVDATNKISTLRAVIGKYKTDEEGVRRSFLIAQDVNAVLPEAVVTASEDDDTLLLQYTDTIPLLVAAIKELKAELDATKAEIAALKGAA